MMKILQLTLFCIICATSIDAQGLLTPQPSSNIGTINGAQPPPPPPPAPLPTLAQDLDEIYRLIQFKPLYRLISRYLLNDAQFQSLVRIINSHQAFVLRLRLHSQPEIVAFTRWVNTQLLLSGGTFELEDSEQTISLISPYPYWSATVYGLEGFLNELQLYCPQYAIRAHIDSKILQNGIFTQFWARLQALQPVYERVLTLPEAQQIFSQLQAAGINTQILDQFIRDLLGWNVPVATSAAPPVVTSPTTVGVPVPVPVKPIVPVA